MRFLLPRWLCSTFSVTCLAVALAPAGAAQGTYSLAPPTVGSGSVADADPPVIRPTTKPCKVQLFRGYTFNGYTTQTFSYAPPAECPGPWAKVVFAADFSVSGTNQFDRTAEIQLGDTMIYFGTTEEPSPTEQPSWHVESDLTDYTALFKSAQPGTVELGNTVNSTYNGIQTGSASLEFYPANYLNPAPRTADQVLPLPETAGAQSLNTTADSISRTFTLPANIEEAYLDVYTQGQSSDEFWWSCVPNDALTILAATYPCGNTAFREAEVTVDGKLAGLAPVYPYVFTGGFDPYLWRPIPGVQTLNFKPYRLDLTPFAGELDDGQPHTVSVSVYNADSYFQADATLLLFQDHFADRVTGGLTGSTLGPVSAPKVVEHLGSFSTTGSGSVMVSDAQSYKLTGYVNTSHGTVETAVESQLGYSNEQVDTNFGNTEAWTQTTRASRKTITHEGLLATEKVDNLTFPFKAYYNFAQNPDGTGAQTVSFDQKLTEYKSESLLGFLLYASSMTDEVKPIDTLDFDASFSVTGEPVDTSTETYTYMDTLGHCWDRTVSANDEKVSAVSDGKTCPEGINHWQ